MEEESLYGPGGGKAAQKSILDFLSTEISALEKYVNAQTIHVLLTALKKQYKDGLYNQGCEILSFAIEKIKEINKPTAPLKFFNFVDVAFQKKDNKTQFKNYVILVDLLNAYYQNGQSEQDRKNILNQLLKNYFYKPGRWHNMIIMFVETFYAKDESKQQMNTILQMRQELGAYRSKNENIWNQTLKAFDQFALQAIRGEITGDEKSELINVGELIQGRLEGIKDNQDILNKSNELKLSHSKFFRGLGIVLGVAGCLLAVVCIVGLGVAYGGLFTMTALDTAIKLYAYMPMLLGAGIAAGGYMIYSRNKLTESTSVQSLLEKTLQENYKPMKAG